MNDTANTLVGIGWILFGVGLVLGAFGFTQIDSTEVVDQLQVAAIVATPFTIAGAVLAAAGHLLRGR